MNDRFSRLTVRVKLVDLNHNGGPSRTSTPRGSGHSVSALVGSSTEQPGRLRAVGIEAGISIDPPLADSQAGEICMKDQRTVPFADFENHIETCQECANRVDLQLDFIETLEVAMFQRQAEPESSKIHGALLISAPKLNFAICGEIDI
jgi:hypothetical protein